MTRHLIIDVETIPIADAATYVTPVPVEEVSAPSLWKDPVKIAAYLERRSAEVIAEADAKNAENLARCSLDPDLCRMICLGWNDGTDTDAMIFPCVNEDHERAALITLWEMVDPYTRLVGFNILSFDIRVLLRRSLYLGVKAPDLQIERFKHPQIEDLMLRLCWGDPYKAHSLAFYVQRFGLPAIEDDMTGADIGALVAADQWDKVAQHCRADVLRTLALARRLGVMPIPVTEAVPF